MVMVAVIAEATSTTPTDPTSNPKSSSDHLNLQNPQRPPLSDNGLVVGPRKPKAREVPSRYLSASSSTSRRCPSPLDPRTPNAVPSPSPSPAAPRRSQSADRRRRPVATPPKELKSGNAGELSAASKLMFTSTRSLSVSFQGEAFSLPVSKTKEPPPPPNMFRKATPERRRTTISLSGKITGGGGGGKDQAENLNSRPNDHRWPGRTRQANLLSVSGDCGSNEDKKKLIGSDATVRTLKQSMIAESAKRLSLDLGRAELLKCIRLQDCCPVPADFSASDTDSVSSGSTSRTIRDDGGTARGKNVTRCIAGSPRFWQETNSRLRRLQNPSVLLSASPMSRMVTPRKIVPPKRFSGDDSLATPRTMSSPLKRAGATARTASPSRTAVPLPMLPPRGILSPVRERQVASSTLSNSNSSTSSAPSFLSFCVDVSKRRAGGNSQIVDARLLRLLHNWHLQWRFVNARAEASGFMQKRSTEKLLWNTSIRISELRRSVRLKRVELQLLKRKLKLTSTLKGQLAYLEKWVFLDREHSIFLEGTIEALKASTFQLPLVGGAVVDCRVLKDAIVSATNVMHAVTSSICSFLSQVEDLNSLVSELVDAAAEGRVLLGQCTDLLSILAAMQVTGSSLRAQKLQLNRVTTA